MKKYHQLVFTVVAIVSSALFIFYKHEYDRLRAVLEVLDTFGSSVEHTQECAAVKNEEMLTTPHFSTSWQQLYDVYLYSAHRSDGAAVVKILSVGGSFKNINKECLMWPEQRKKPVTGEISIEYLDHNWLNVSSTSRPAILICTTKPAVNYKLYAVSISLSVQEKTFEQFVYISEPNDLVSTENAIAACILLPQRPFTNKLQIAEYLEFHRIVGLNHFYLYDRGLEPEVRRFLYKYQQGTSIPVTIISWNPPQSTNLKPEELLTILRNDCLFRSRSAVKYVTMSNVNHILIPRHHTTLQAILHDIEDVSPRPISYFQFSFKLFCLEYSDDPYAASAPLTTLQKTRWKVTDTSIQNSLINVKAAQHITINFTVAHDSSYQSYMVPGDIASLHKYEKCGMEVEKGNRLKQHDDVAYKFKDKLLQSDWIKQGL